MVLNPAQGGALRGASRPGNERGSQALEFALTLPAFFLLLALVLQAALLGADLVAVQGLAREAARTAAVADDAAVGATVRAAAGRRAVEVQVDPPSGARVPGELVTARVRLRSRAFEAFGTSPWLPAQATMQVEDR
ncbi:MAG TPA: TadE/TadG family type IV pilus assembly protein [Egibacteraceae bacterium]|nr:TadE/TadG family type IV pilus assembly protein [Egibacteraceae bacterium]